MRWLWIFFLIGAQALADRKTCEVQMSKPALRFVRLLPTGLQEGSITPESLRHMIESPQPTNPIDQAREVDNLSRRNAFRREIPHISEQQWRLVVTKAREFERDRLKKDGLVAEAKKQTKNIWGIIPSSLRLGHSQQVSGHIVTAKGDAFFCTSDGRDSFVYNINTRSVFKIDGQPSGRTSSDFFETANGDVLLTILSEKKLSVYNVRSRIEFMTVDLTDSPWFTEYRPLIFEEKGVPTVILGNQSSRITERYANQAIYKIPIRQGLATPQLMNGKYIGPDRTVRLANGHLYEYSLIKIEGTSDPLTKVVVKDLTLGTDVFRVETKESLADHHSALIFNRGPQLIFQPNSPSAYWKSLDPQTGKLHTIEFSLSADDIPWLMNLDGEAVSARVHPVMEPAQVGMTNKLYITKISPLRTQTVNLDFASNNVSANVDQMGFSTPHGDYILSWEGNYQWLHLYNVKKKETMKLVGPPELGEVAEIFYNPADDTILMFGVTRLGQWKLYQIFGPDGERL